MTSPSPLRLAAFTAAGPVSGNHGGWRYPGADTDILSARYWRRLGRHLDEAGYDMMFIADILAVPRTLEGRHDSQLRYGALGALRLDPMAVLSLVAGVTENLGLAATMSTTYYQPFHLARAMATLDHLSDGRAAWNIVTSFQDAEAANFGTAQHLTHDERYDRADEFAEVVCKLWDSWEDGALLRDAAQPLYADPARVHAIDHHGPWFDVAGPLNVSRSPQGRPVFVQAGASPRGRAFAARWADVVFSVHASLESAQDFYRAMKAEAASLGRDPGQLVILAGIAPLVGETEAAAREKDAIVTALAEGRAGLSTLAFHLGIDLAEFPQDKPLPVLDDPAIHGHYREVAELTQRHGLSLAEIGKRYGIKTNRFFIGGYQQVADRMEEWLVKGACDGFMVQPPWFFGALEDFSTLVIPELQRRGLRPATTAAGTLRDRLGLARP